MPQAIVTLPDFTKAKVTFDTPEQLDSTIEDLVATHPVGNLFHKDALSRGQEAIGQPLLAAATGLAGSALGGVRGLARGAGAAAGALAQGEGVGKALDVGTDEATRTIEETQKAFTVQPTSRAGEVGQAIVSWPFQKLGAGITAVAQKGGELAQAGLEKAGVSPQTAIRAGGAVAAGGEVVGQGAASLATGGLSRMALRTVRGAGAAEEAAGAAGARAGTQAGATPEGARGATAGAEPANIKRARDYAARNGLDWSRLSALTRKALTSIARDATALDKLNPASLRREAALQRPRIPVPATRGQITLDPVQLRREAVTASTGEGAPIREIYSRGNEAVQANLEVLRGRLAGRRSPNEAAPAVNEEAEEIPGLVRSSTKAPTQVGASLQDIAREKNRWVKGEASKLFDTARKTEPTAEASTRPVTDLLTENPDIQHLGWVQGWINKARAARARKEGVPPEEVSLDKVTLNELHDLRSLSLKHGAGADGHYAAELRKAVDLAMQDVPEGAKAWKTAINAWRKHAEEFKDQPLIRQLVSNKKGTSARALALEKTSRRIATGQVEEIRALKRTLLKGDNPALRIRGAQAWKDLRAEIVNRILEDARDVSTVDETERAVLTEAALRRSIKRFPRENLEEILGKGAVRELYTILRAKRLSKRPSPESGTVPNALVMAEKVLGLVPGAGKYMAGAVRGVHKMGTLGESTRVAEQATQTPLQEAAAQAERKATTPEEATLQRLRKYQQLEPGAE